MKHEWSKNDWEDKVLISNYDECSPVGPEFEEIYQNFKDRLLKDITIQLGQKLCEKDCYEYEEQQNETTR